VRDGGFERSDDGTSGYDGSSGYDVGGDVDDADEYADVDRAPICPNCGVTALPAYSSNVLDSPFLCDNEDCDAFGEPV
jgi:hypothetical protein